MHKNSNFFNYTTNGFEQKMQAYLALKFAREQLLDQQKHRQELEQMKQEITADVLAQVSIWIESEAVSQLEDMLNNLVH